MQRLDSEISRRRDIGPGREQCLDLSPPPANDPSVGMEQLYGRPEEFARRDPEYFDWLWKWVVRGETD